MSKKNDQTQTATIYLIEEHYTVEVDGVQVELTLWPLNNRMTIKSQSNDGKFLWVKFDENQSGDRERWPAVLEAISAAIKLGRKELTKPVCWGE